MPNFIKLKTITYIKKMVLIFKLPYSKITQK